MLSLNCMFKIVTNNFFSDDTSFHAISCILNVK